MAALAKVVDDFGRAIVELSNPSLDYDNRATKGWPFIAFSQALPTALAYLALVAYGNLKYAKYVEEQKAKGAVAATDAKKASKPVWSVSYALNKLNSDKQFPIVWLLFFYNIVQVTLCGYMMYEAASIAYYNYPSLVCNPFNGTDSKLANVLWLFYVSKVLDFFDTIVIVIRGTWNQFSFLHTYHHFSIFLTYWLVANAGMDGDVYYTVVANSFVHLVMYFYYGLKVLGVSVSWDIAVTSLQMIQFVTMNIQAIAILYGNCAYPHRVTGFYLIYIISLFCLFGHFFYTKYVAGGRTGGSKKAVEDSKGGKKKQ